MTSKNVKTIPSSKKELHNTNSQFIKIKVINRCILQKLKIYVAWLQKFATINNFSGNKKNIAKSYFNVNYAL